MGENNIIDYGKWIVPTSWNQITLKQYQEIEAFYDNAENKSFDVREVIHILCNKTIDEVNALPVEFLDDIMEKMSFLQTKVTEQEPTNTLMINGEKYVVNIQNKLKVGEYVAVDSIIKDDKHNYAAMLAILCRKEGELYDSKFENEILEDRVHMWEQQPITDVLRVISFFFAMLHDISDSYPTVFKNKGSNRPHSQGYRDFAQKWGNLKTLYEICDEKIEKVREVYQEYLNDYLTFLSYLIDKGEAERQEDEFQELRRKATKGRR